MSLLLATAAPDVRRRPMLLAVHVRWGEMLLGGAKTAEFRPRAPRDGAEGRVAVLYAAAPVRAVLGEVLFRAQISGSRTAVWREVRRQGEEPGTPRGEYMERTRGWPVVHALLVRRAVHYRWRGRLSAAAPQGWRWLKPGERDSILARAPGSML